MKLSYTMIIINFNFKIYTKFNRICYCTFKRIFCQENNEIRMKRITSHSNEKQDLINFSKVCKIVKQPVLYNLQNF